MSLKENLLKDQQDAMRRKDMLRVSTVRMVRAAITNAEIEQGRGCKTAKAQLAVQVGPKSSDP